MRVDLLTREYPPFTYGGAGEHVAGLARHLRPLVDLRVHCHGTAREEDGVRAHRAPAPLAEHDPATEAMAISLAMAEAVRGSSVVHSHTWYANFAGHLAKIRHSLPHVVTAHSLEPLRPWKGDQLADGYRVSSWLERSAVAGADRVIAVSDAMAADVSRVYPEVDEARISVVYNGIDLAEFAADDGTDELVGFGIGPDRPVVACVARITPQKGLHHLLRAARHFSPDAHLVVVAQHADSPRLRRSFANDVLAARAAGCHVTWIGDHFTRRALKQLLTLAQVFVCPSVYEPMGIVILEAMACGAPVVATATGGIREVVVDGGTGLLVPIAPAPGGLEPADPEIFAKEIAARVEDLLHDPATADRMGRAGRLRVATEFSWAKSAAQVKSIYEAVTRD
ncbi:glycogen synthase [Streptomyces sp. NPDC050388]|uniref:glycogen synthase n=1 Tax=Streptomyces sp. NPDC050388 TaxID=3155781 RepID=UPI0034239ACE